MKILKGIPYLVITCSLLVLNMGQHACASEKDIPNIVFILVDDMGYGDLGCMGCQDIATPNIDRLANEGVRFTDFYANAPVCSPCLLYTSPSPRDRQKSRMPSSA